MSYWKVTNRTAVIVTTRKKANIIQGCIMK